MTARTTNKNMFCSLSLNVAPPLLPYVHNLIRKRRILSRGRLFTSRRSARAHDHQRGRRRPCARPRHESALRGRSRQKATSRNGNSLHQHILSHSIVLDEVFGPFVKRHVGTLVVYFFSFFMSNRRVNDSSIFSNRVNDSFVF